MKRLMLLMVYVFFVIALSACGGGGGGGGDGDTNENSAPIANAGADQNITTGSTVTLSGGGSDADGDLLAYSWAFTSKPSGSTATLSDATVANPTFVAGVDGIYVLTLTVDDGKEISLVDSVTITAASLNSDPTANAGLDQNVVTGTLVTLSGTGSDADSDLLSFSWTFTSRPSGSTATLSNMTVANPSFTADMDGTYILTLTVNDGTVNSQVDSVTVTAATLNSAPTANAGPDQNVATGDLVTLNGGASSDANDDLLTYSWAFTSKPNGSSAALSSSTGITATFTPDVAGAYVLNLVVNDGEMDSDISTVTVIAHTEATGIITTNTTWSSVNSPYQMTGNVQIDFGVTLVIEPGVTVIGNGLSLVVGGTLKAHGSVDHRITFENVAIKPAASTPSLTHLIDISFANIQDGSLYAPGGNAIYGTLALSDSRIESLKSYLYLWYPTSTVIIDRNVFLNSGGISCGFDARTTAIEVKVRNNYFENWSENFAIKNWAAYGSTVGIQVELNTFASLNRVAVELPPGYSSSAITATNNWWGTTDTTTISSMIFDKNDDISSANVITFQPILTEPDSATPTP